MLELLQLGGPGQRADNVDVDVIRAPLGGGHAGQATDALLGGSVGALAVVAEQAGTGGKVDHAAVGLLQVGVAGLHIIEGCVQARIQGQVELLGGVLGQRDAGSRGLCVVDHIAAGDNKVCTLFCVGCSNAVSNGTAAAILQDCAPCTGDECGLTR